MQTENCFVCFRFGCIECPPNRWGPPSCNGICDYCYNGGICDDKTGGCVCRPGFSGPNCLNGKVNLVFSYSWNILLILIGKFYLVGYDKVKVPFWLNTYGKVYQNLVHFNKL